MNDQDKPDNSSAGDKPATESNNDSRPFVVQQPERAVPFPFNAKPEETAGSSVVETTDTSATTPPKKSKKKLLIAWIATALLLLGLALAYVYWFQNPNKVVSDAFVHALNSKSVTYTGTVTSAGSNKMVVTLNGGAVAEGATVNAKLAYETDGKEYTLDGNGIVDKKNDIYFKVQNIDSLVNNYRRAIPTESQPLFDQIIDKIDDKWVKVSSDDLKELSPNLVKAQECLRDSVNEMQSDSAVKNELINVYKKHPFITIDKTLGAKDGSLGYVLTTNNEAEKAFNKELRNTSFHKSLVKCDSSFADDDEEVLEEYTDNFNEDGTIELWVDRWSHQITKVTLKQEERGQTTNMSIEPKFNRPVAIVTPKDATTLEQLQKDIQALLGSAQVAPASETTMSQDDSMMES